MEKAITIDGKEVGLKATALTPRLYRYWLGRDMISDMSKLRKAYWKRISLPENATEEEKEEAQLTHVDLEIFESCAWVMARQYASNHPESLPVEKTVEEWLDTFATFSIYEVMPEILELWAVNNQTTSISKKN